MRKKSLICVYCGFKSNNLKEHREHQNHCAMEHDDPRVCIMCGATLDDYDHENTCIKCE